MSTTVPRTIISIGAFLIILIRHIFPQLRIDTIDIILVILILLPWLSGLIKEIEVPGFGKIGFQDVISAGDKIIQNTFSNLDNYNELELNSVSDLSNNPNTLFIIVRIQIENRIRQIAEINKIPTSLSVIRLINELVDREVIKQSMGNGLIDFINLGNKAAQGAKVDPSAAIWVKENASRIFKSLDDIIKNAF